ncbi:pirin family protein [Psychromonas antarctica]|jgi:redox-sensitive bicupin YhaK (pirin superfamily)|uniref:pirin family protein n=1 Tax=Psychromonas antarctica TaxID=67573 RepID=UPI001EE81FFD|nr:pirin-like bicupin family protein [Psychromonas antarctica]MCG6201119.1 pirin family protein [Psychromonas antarctica]
MIKAIRYSDLGHADHGWLQSRFHFSFADYYNPKRMGFGKLRVINDDLIKPGYGFDLHPHKNMEIISYIRSGAVSHQDSEGNKGITNAGEIQVMSAGSGILHSEYNLGQTPLTLYQIWIETDKVNVRPRWETQKFPIKPVTTELPLLVSGFVDEQADALFINQKARIFGGCLKHGTVLTQNISGQAYLLISEGNFSVSSGSDNKITLNKGDAAELTDIKELIIEALVDAEIILIDLPN